MGGVGCGKEVCEALELCHLVNHAAEERDVGGIRVAELCPDGGGGFGGGGGWRHC
jgi:hypothetical protein